MLVTSCLVLVLSIGGLATFPAVLPLVRSEWSLSNTAAGWITGSYQGGYMLLVPVLAALSDRVPVKRILLASTLFGALSSLAFVFLVHSVWSAVLCQACSGAALAGIYMPGLKGLADWVRGPRQGRYVSFYTASFTVGTSLSFIVAGAAAHARGWRAGFGAAAVEQAAAFLLVAAFIPSTTPSSHHEGSVEERRSIRAQFTPVFRTRAAMDFIWGYAAHMWELFALRAWLVPFLAYTLSLRGSGGAWSAPGLAAFITLLGVPASIGGQEAASRFGSRALIISVMVGAAVVSTVVGWTAWLPFWATVVTCSLYSIAVSADSAPLTAAAIAAAPPGCRGATMAVHSTLGFTSAAIGTLVVGAALDALGGDTPLAWGLAFPVMGITSLAGIWRLRRRG